MRMGSFARSFGRVPTFEIQVMAIAIELAMGTQLDEAVSGSESLGELQRASLFLDAPDLKPVFDGEKPQVLGCQENKDV